MSTTKVVRYFFNKNNTKLLKKIHLRKSTWIYMVPKRHVTVTSSCSNVMLRHQYNTVWGMPYLGAIFGQAQFILLGGALEVGQPTLPRLFKLSSFSSSKFYNTLYSINSSWYWIHVFDLWYSNRAQKDITTPSDSSHIEGGLMNPLPMKFKSTPNEV